MRFIRILIVFLISLQLNGTLFAQDKIVLDKVIAVVGNEIVTKYEFEKQYNDLIAQGIRITDESRCQIIEDIMASKLLINQAKIDSIEITDNQVESEMDRRMRYMISQAGSEQALETYYKVNYDKSLSQIKNELRKSLRDQLLIQSMRGQITSDVQATPEEVSDYYNGLSEDSIPLINAEVEVAHILAYAPVSDAATEEVKNKLREFKKRVSEGEKFSTLAVLYSEDNTSAVKGGEIGFVGKAEVDPEYAAAAFQLKVGQVSPIVKSSFGYHIIQLIERRANKINTRHILLRPKNDQASMDKAKARLDSLLDRIENKEITFKEAAQKYSDDEETRKNGGILRNPSDNSSLIPMDGIDPSIFFVIDKMNIGEVSKAVPIQDPRSKPGYRIIRLNKRTEPHKASLEKDYQRIKSNALFQKQEVVLNEWVSKAIENTYLKLDLEYIGTCKFVQPWVTYTEKSN